VYILHMRAGTGRTRWRWAPTEHKRHRQRSAGTEVHRSVGRKAGLHWCIQWDSQEEKSLSEETHIPRGGTATRQTSCVRRRVDRQRWKKEHSKASSKHFRPRRQSAQDSRTLNRFTNEIHLFVITKSYRL